MIVMLTALEEKNKKKADQYWPDEDNKDQTISDNIQLGRGINSLGSTCFTLYFKIKVKPKTLKPFPRAP